MGRSSVKPAKAVRQQKQQRQPKGSRPPRPPRPPKTAKVSKASAAEPAPSGLARYARTVSKSSGASQYSPDQTMPPSPIPSVLCPVANAHGGQDGVIPPGVAAQLGLYRRIRLHEANLEEAATHQREMARRTVKEQYEDLYASIEAEEAEDAEDEESREADELSDAVDGIDDVEDADDPATGPASDDLDGDYGEDVGMFSTRQTDPAPAWRRVRPASAGSGAGRTALYGDDTLDGFYDELHDRPVRTMVRERSRREERLELENDDLRDAADRLRARVATLKGKLESQEAELGDLRGRLADAESAAKAAESVKEAEASRAAPEAHATVRVALGEDEGRILIGGHGPLGTWQCRITGHLDRSRDGRELVLSVRDSGYASEVQASISPGRVSMVTLSGREECEYSGVCMKLYASSGDSDYITLFGFRTA